MEPPKEAESPDAYDVNKLNLSLTGASQRMVWEKAIPLDWKC